MSHFDKEKYEAEKEKAHGLYKSIKKAYSPALKCDVNFNADGFRHLLLRDEIHKRNWKDTLKRFQLLRHVKGVVEGMGYFQEYSEKNKFIPISENKREKRVDIKRVHCWGFVVIIQASKPLRIKVVLKRVGNGEVMFWSVMPFWKDDHYRELAVEITTGDLEND